MVEKAAIYLVETKCY